MSCLCDGLIYIIVYVYDHVRTNHAFNTSVRFLLWVPSESQNCDDDDHNRLWFASFGFSFISFKVQNSLLVLAALVN